MQVHEGTIAISSGEQTVTRNVRGALSFLGDLAHSYVNAGPQTPRFSVTVLDPGVGSATRTDRSYA